MTSNDSSAAMFAILLDWPHNQNRWFKSHDYKYWYNEFTDIIQTDSVCIPLYQLSKLYSVISLAVLTYVQLIINVNMKPK